MIVLDLFCGEGGASMGYNNAGFKVIGVDNKEQKKYPFKFIQDDAILVLHKLKDLPYDFDLIHASPPCQGYSGLTPAISKHKHEKLISEVRRSIVRTGIPYVIENVYGAKKELNNPVMLCGSMFGLRTQRHRYFETSFEVEAPKNCDHSQLPLLVTTASKGSREKRFKLGIQPKTVLNAPMAYGVDWMSGKGLSQCIPPAYTYHVGVSFLHYFKTSKKNTK